MGMDYYIMPNVETNCNDDFPAGLSYFFEQVGGCGEYSEVMQVSKILQTDLSIFQQISFDEYEDYDEGGEDAEPVWHDIDSVSELISVLLTKISAFPEYHTQVLYNPVNIFGADSEYRNLKELVDKSTESELSYQEAVKRISDLEAHPLFCYPSNQGYLSKGEITEDLKDLEQLLRCYRVSGATKIKLTYM